MNVEAFLAHPAVRSLAALVERSPWAGSVWLVGGCVRDALLGRTLGSDFDLVLEGDAIALAAWLGENGAAGLAVFPRFGTAGVNLNQARFEFVAARQETYDPTSRKPFVELGTLTDDAQRRDFTCNTLMVNLNDGRLLDLLNVGQQDLYDHVLRTPRQPRQTLFDDPLRMLRAVRFRHQLGFSYEMGLEEALRHEAPRLQAISAERIRDEFCKLIRWPLALQELMDFGLMQFIAPELIELQGVEQGKWHHLDVWHHTLLVIQNAASDDLILNLACLFHDVGKPSTRCVDVRGETRFFSHEVVGADMVRKILRRLRFNNDTIDAVATLVKNHMRLSAASTLTAPAARRLIRDLNGQLDRLLALVEADAKALRPGVKTLDVQAIRHRLEEVAAETPAEKIRAPITGEEVMEILGIGPGPRVGDVLHLLMDQVIEGQLGPDDKDKAREMVRRFAE